MNDELELTPPPPPHDAQLTLVRSRIGWIVHALRAGLVLLMLVSLLHGSYSIWRSEQTRDALLQFLKIDPSRAPAFVTPALAGFVILNWVTFGLLLAAGWRLASGYLAGEIFTPNSVRRLRVLGLFGLARELLFVAPTHYALVAAASREPLSWRALNFALAPTVVQWSLFFCFLLVLAAVFKVAAEIADEHRHFA